MDGYTCRRRNSGAQPAREYAGRRSLVSMRGPDAETASALPAVGVAAVHPAVAVVVDQVGAGGGARRSLVGGGVDRGVQIIAVGRVGRQDTDLIDGQGVERVAARAVRVPRADDDRAAD